MSERGDRYRYLVVNPGRREAALTELASAPTLGVEVTDRELADACDLGNLDPQHEGGSTMAAIEAALQVDPPPPGTTLATIRPDLDSLGAMAVLTLRAAGRELDDASRRRIARIAVADGPRGVWPGPAAGQPDPQRLSDIGRVVTDAARAIQDRVAALADWIELGVVADTPPQAATSIEPDVDISARLWLTAGTRIAIVQSTDRGALSLGYRWAPVVIAENPRFRLEQSLPYRKLTVAQYGPGYVDLLAVRKCVSSVESGWGGTSTVLGSPQGRGSTVSLLHLAGVVASHLSPIAPSSGGIP